MNGLLTGSPRLLQPNAATTSYTQAVERYDHKMLQRVDYAAPRSAARTLAARAWAVRRGVWPLRVRDRAFASWAALAQRGVVEWGIRRSHLRRPWGADSTVVVQSPTLSQHGKLQSSVGCEVIAFPRKRSSHFRLRWAPSFLSDRPAALCRIASLGARGAHLHGASSLASWHRNAAATMGFAQSGVACRASTSVRTG